jgi:hypothetical protein
MQSSDVTYYNMISDVVEFTFNNDGIECYNPEVTWYNEVDYYYEQMEAAQNGEDEEEEEEEDDGEEPEAAEWCQELIDDDAAVDLATCGNYEAEEANDDENNDADDAVASYDWYTYELTEEQFDEIGSVCAVYTGMIAAADAAVDSDTGSYSTYKPHTTYNPDHENLFNYNKSSSQASGGKIFGWILLFVVVAGGTAAFAMQKSTSSAKKQPLISENEGTMA